jgi:CIC family chloride channel protein
LSPGDRPTSPSISDGLFYCIAGICGFATGVVGAAFHLTVDALLRWPIWLIERLGPGPIMIAAAAAIAAVGTTLAFLLTQRVAPRRGQRVPEVEGALEGSQVRWRASCVKLSAACSACRRAWWRVARDRPFTGAAIGAACRNG